MSRARCGAFGSGSFPVIGSAVSSPPTIWTALASSTAIAERSLIESIAAELATVAGPDAEPAGDKAAATARAGSELLRGVGDDAAVVRARPVSVTSLDAVVDGVHFRIGDGWRTPGEVGRLAVAGALSDLAAMGAEPGEAYLLLGLPRGFHERDALDVVRGARLCAEENGTVIAGGDVVRAPALTVSVTAVGWAESADQLVGRDGAIEGDLVGVTGALGGAGAALAVMEGRALAGAAATGLLERARAPAPRLAEGRALARAGVHALIDLSDGIATDAGHIGRASGLSLALRLRALPLQEGVAEVCGELGVDPWRMAACAGEDYELCFCAAPAQRERVEDALRAAGPTTVTWIGEVRSGSPGVEFSDEQGGDVPLQGFEHRWD
jgi:thiamine-monophosphate kinase